MTEPVNAGPLEPVVLDSSSATPLYRQIADYLLSEIAQGSLAPGSALGSEAELQEQFNVSRVTLRQAVKLLVEQGLVVRKQGKGTYVQARPLDFPLDTLEGTTQRASTLVPTRSEVKQLRTVKATGPVRRALQLDQNSYVLEVQRLDLVGAAPLAYATIHLPREIGEGLSVEDLTDEALYPLLERRRGVVATYASQTIEADTASDPVAVSLGLPARSPVLVVTRSTFDERNRPIEYSVIQFSPKLMHFSVALRRQQGEVAPYLFQEQLRPSLQRDDTVLRVD